MTNILDDNGLQLSDGSRVTSGNNNPPQLTAVQASNNLTITLKAPWSANFRSTNLSSGLTDKASILSDITLVIPNGATLGAPAAITSASATMAGTTTLTINTGPTAPIQRGAIIFQAGTRIGKVSTLGTYVGGVGTGTVILDATATFTAQAIVIINPARLLLLAINNAGTIELAVVNQSGGVSLDETGLISTTAIGAGSTSATTIYSTSARTSVAYKVIGFIDVAEATVGTYALAPELTFGAIGTTLAAIFTPGIGQSWSSNLSTTERVLTQTYTNIYGREITVCFQANSGSSTTATITINGVTSVGNFVNGNAAGVISSLTFQIPAGHTYSFNGTAILIAIYEKK